MDDVWFGISGRDWKGKDGTGGERNGLAIQGEDGRRLERMMYGIGMERGGFAILGEGGSGTE